MPILPIDPLIAAAGAAHKAQALVASFNTAFDLIVTFSIYLLPVVAAIRLVQRS